MVKKILRAFAIETAALYLTSVWFEGLVFTGGIESLLLTGFALGLASMLIKPLINIFLMPINLVTFNLFRWLNNVVMLFLVDLILPNFTITSFSFPGLISTYLDLPPVALPEGIGAYFGFAIVISLISGIIHWLLD
jgi:putative membrane protein